MKAGWTVVLVAVVGALAVGCGSGRQVNNVEEAAKKFTDFEQSQGVGQLQNVSCTPDNGFYRCEGASFDPANPPTVITPNVYGYVQFDGKVTGGG